MRSGFGSPQNSVFLAVRNWYRAILLVAAIMLAGVGSASAERVALVIGNGAYKNAGALTNPPKDARAIATKLQELNFSVTVALDADLAEMRQALTTFTEAARNAEVAVVFYAGHGLQVDGENYLIPVDAGLRARGDLGPESVSASSIYESLVAAGPELAVLILDACRDNPFVKAVATSPGLATGSVSAASFVQRPNSAGMLIGFAAAPGAVAFDGGKGNSPFTTALLQWIDRPGLELGTMLRRVRGTVVELTRGAQVPWVEEALLREVYLYPADPALLARPEVSEPLQVALLDTINGFDDPAEQSVAREFYSRLTDADDAQNVLMASLGDTATNLDDDFMRQGLIWLSIRRGSDIKLLETYIAAFPGSPFVPAARDRVAKLQEEAAQKPVEVAGLIILGAADGVATDVVTIDEAPSGAVSSKPEVVAVAPSQSTGTLVLGEPLGKVDAPPADDVVELQAALPADSALTPLENDSVAPVAPGADAVVVPSASEQLAAVQEDVNPLTPQPDPSETEATLELGSTGLAAVQILLKEAGEYRGAADARFGPGTRKAIESFQKAGDLEVTGHVDQATLRLLVSRYGGAVLRSKLDDAGRDALHRVAAIAERGPGARETVLRVAAMSRNDDVHAFWQELALAFEAGHPGYRVRIDHQPDYSYKETLLGMLGSETPPDIMHTWGGGHLEALREAGFARDITSEMSEGWALEFRPGALQNYTRDGRIFGAPSSIELISLWVNTELLRKAGVSADSLRTWDGFLLAVRDLRAANIVPIAIGGQDRWPFQLLWGSLAEQIGGRAAIDALSDPSGEGFLAPAFVEAGEKLRQLAALDPFQPDFLSADESEAGMTFTKGGAAMVITGNWRLTTMRWNWPGGFERMQAELKRLDFPTIADHGGELLTYGGADGYAVNSKAPDMAVKLLRVLTSRQVQNRIAELAHAIPSVSGSDLSLADPFMADVAKSLLQSSHHQLYLDQVIGPVAGNVLNDVTTKLVIGEMQGIDAAREIDRAWDIVLLGRSSAPSNPDGNLGQPTSVE